MAAHYKIGNDNESDNNEDKVCSLHKDNVNGSRVRSLVRSYDLACCDHDVTISFFFGVSSDKQIIVKKLFATRYKIFKPYKRKRRKTNAFLMRKNKTW